METYETSKLSGDTWAGVDCWHKGSMACWCQPASRAGVVAEHEGGRRHKTVVTCWTRGATLITAIRPAARPSTPAPGRAHVLTSPPAGWPPHAGVSAGCRVARPPTLPPTPYCSPADASLKASVQQPGGVCDPPPPLSLHPCRQYCPAPFPPKPPLTAFRQAVLSCTQQHSLADQLSQQQAGACNTGCMMPHCTEGRDSSN